MNNDSLYRVAAAISLRFSNLHQAILMSMEMALRQLPEGSPAAIELNSGIESLYKANEIISQMQTYVGHVRDTRHLIDLSEVCLESLGQIRPLLPRGITLYSSCPSPGPAIKSNRSEVHQILNILISNACEAIPETRGTVRMAVRIYAGDQIPSDNRIPADFTPGKGRYACLEVADSGCGIPIENIQLIFEPFFSTKFEGRGLGLAVIGGIAMAVHGAITVESEPARGSTFRLFLPIAGDTAFSE
jgi:two-component system, cell cycle sensor histidine kinase and response regulator CckA